MRSTKGLFFLLLVLGSFSLFSQSITTPYSNYGIGELGDYSLPHNESLGGFGVGGPELYNINSANPAWLPYNFLTGFQIGLKGESRRYIGGEGNTSDKTGSLRYLATVFPLIPQKWTTSLTLLPYSSINYNLLALGTIDQTGEQVENVFTGSGGLTQLSWSHGFTLVNNLTMGVRASFVFGSLDKSTRNTVLSTEDVGFSVSYLEETSYSDVTLGVSFGNRVKIEDEKFIYFGGVIDLPKKLSGTRNTRLSRFPANGAIELPDAVQIDDDVPVTFKTPTIVTIGGSFDKVNTYQFGLDIKYQNWESSDAIQEEVRNTLTISAAGRIIPDYKSVNNYFKRISYRFGFQYKEIPYVINSQKINEFGINFGISLPMTGGSSLDTAFRFGWRGTTENDLVRENIYQVVFGLTINDRWFVKRRYD